MIVTTNPTIVYTSSKDETITLNFWNLQKENSTYTLNSESVTLADCGGKIKDAHHVRVIELKAGEVIELSSEIENSIEVVL